MISPGKEQA